MFTLCLLEKNVFYVSIDKITPKELSADTSFISECSIILKNIGICYRCSQNWEVENEHLQLK